MLLGMPKALCNLPFRVLLILGVARGFELAPKVKVEQLASLEAQAL